MMDKRDDLDRNSYIFDKAGMQNNVFKNSQSTYMPWKE